MDDGSRILEFMSKNPLMVVSTVNQAGQPESAVVGFGQTDNLELIFNTLLASRKARNILTNSNVSVVIGWDSNGTLQYEGIARKLEGDEADAFSEIYFQKSPSARPYKTEPNNCYFLISLKWLRFTDIKSTLPKITELTF